MTAIEASANMNKEQDIPPCIILSQLSLGHYIPLFQQENIDLDSFLNFKKNHFISLGIQDPGDLWLLMNCSKQLKSHIQEKRNRYSVCESILEEDYSMKSCHATTASACSSSDIISKVLRAYDSYNNTNNASLQKNLIAPPGTVVPRNNNKPARPFSMPVQLPSALPPPPDYHQLLLRRLDKSRSMVLPREEEGREELPAYSCTVYKTGYVFVKKEYDALGIKSRRRSWRKLYVELRGTLLKVYRAAPLNTELSNAQKLENYARWSLKLPFYYYYRYYYTPVYTISLAGAEASRAFDYAQRPNALRLTTQHGLQLLLRLMSHHEMISWIEHLQAAINISLDLELRPMPKFITIPTRGIYSAVLDPRTIELERAREQRRRNQQEMLI